MFSKLFTIKFKSNYFIHHIIVVLIFSILYYLSSILIEDSIIKKRQLIIKDDNNDGDNEYKYKDVGLSFWDCLYFSLVTQTTVGYGDIVMTHNFTRIINFIQLLTIYGVFIFDI
tara:strand:+ start:5532 stop:5873 length:342 start_codon:yes stop_codon:yes gene_type:complete